MKPFLKTYLSQPKREGKKVAYVRYHKKGGRKKERKRVFNYFLCLLPQLASFN
jgi:hypothetical protein